jgi:hypothetical protein
MCEFVCVSLGTDDVSPSALVCLVVCPLEIRSWVDASPELYCTPWCESVLILKNTGHYSVCF